MKENMICGIHIGEHGFDADRVIEEINERVIKPGYNFVTIRTRARLGEIVPHETYVKWAKYLAENKIYFLFLYSIIARGKVLVGTIEKRTVDEMKRIAGEYFLGDMLGELGSCFGAKHEGYSYVKPGEDIKTPYLTPRQDFEDMESAAKEFVRIANDYVQINREIGMPHVSLVEPTALSKYIIMGGVDLPMVELMCAPPDILVSYMRGVSRAFGLTWGSYMAHEWYGGVRHSDPLKRKRLDLGMKYAYLCGSRVMCIESGDEMITAYGERYEAEDDICADYRNALSNLNSVALSDNRDERGPKVSLAFVSGRYDPYASWGGSSAWGQYRRHEWGHSEAEHSWNLLKEIGTKRQWWDIENYGDEDLSALPAYGLYDIVPIEADVDALSKYEYLIFLGWNTMTDEDMDKLTEYVRRGGRLLMTMAHLNYSSRRDGEFLPPPADKLRRLFGVELTGEVIKTNAGVKFSDSAMPEVKYPRVPLEISDPILVSGYLEYPVVKTYEAEPRAMLANSFRTHVGMLPPAVVENKIGSGFATLVCARAYPGNSALTPLYRVMAREMVTASARSAKIKVIASDKLRYSVYEDGKIYLLNTDYDLPITVRIIRSGVADEYVLAPSELKIIEG